MACTPGYQSRAERPRMGYGASFGPSQHESFHAVALRTVSLLEAEYPAVYRFLT